MENSYRIELLMHRAMQNQYSQLVSKFGYSKADTKMSLLFSNWNECKESIWQTQDLSSMEKINKIIADVSKYESNPKLVKNYLYKGYTILEFEQKPCENWIRITYGNTDEEYNGDEIGEGGYVILRPNGEIYEEDFYTMGDSAKENAERSVDEDLKVMGKEKNVNE